jgi:hypothetical protein
MELTWAYSAVPISAIATGFHVARGRQRQARDMLAPIYAWFCEGLETRDLVEARTLLADLQ